MNSPGRHYGMFYLYGDRDFSTRRDLIKKLELIFFEVKFAKFFGVISVATEPIFEILLAVSDPVVFE